MGPCLGLPGSVPGSEGAAPPPTPSPPSSYQSPQAPVPPAPRSKPSRRLRIGTAALTRFSSSARPFPSSEGLLHVVVVPLEQSQTLRPPGLLTGPPPLQDTSSPPRRSPDPDHPKRLEAHPSLSSAWPCLSHQAFLFPRERVLSVFCQRPHGLLSRVQSSEGAPQDTCLTPTASSCHVACGYTCGHLRPLRALARAEVCPLRPWVEGAPFNPEMPGP